MAATLLSCHSLQIGEFSFNSAEAMSSDESLEYVTLDSVPWSKGHQRPRMDPEERKVKHRLVQRRHMERKRQRVAELEATVSMLELQLMWLNAEHEAQRLLQEQDTLRQRLDVRSQPWVLPRDSMTDSVEELAMSEILVAVKEFTSLSFDTLPSPTHAQWQAGLQY